MNRLILSLALLGAAAVPSREVFAKRNTVAANPCVLVLYDRAPEGEAFTYGRLMAQMLQNLLGHFPHLQQKVAPITKYEAGSIESCAATFYLGAYYDNAVPQAFLDDFTRTSKQVVWMGYNVWRLGERLKPAFNASYKTIASPDWANLDPKGVPGFFRHYDYLGETFVKYAEKGGAGVLNAAYDVVVMEPAPGSESNVVSWMRHSTNGARAPYILRNANRWYVADLPFSYMHEEDRYLIFADVLFDMLGEKPLHTGPRPALVRFEDVHSELPGWQLRGMSNLAREADIPFAISLIPHFKDPYDALQTPNGNRPSVKMTERKEFVEWLREQEAGKGTVIMHGYTHQCDHHKNPDGVSGIDYEFWDVVNNRPVEGDSPKYVIERLEEGTRLMELAGLKPAAWLTPHYAASALDNVIFGQTFLWNIGRIGYLPMAITQAKRLPSMFTFDLSGSEMNGRRLPFFKDLKVAHPTGATVPNGMFFPYEIYGDVHNIRLIPESVSYIQPGKHGVEDMLRIMRRNRKLRDTWASFFIHPFLMGTRSDGGLGRFDGDSLELQKLFREAKVLGYEFIHLRKWTKANTRKNRPEPIETF